MSNATEQAALGAERAAQELEVAARHLRTAAAHMHAGEVPRYAAHVLATVGHMVNARHTLDELMIMHAARSQPVMAHPSMEDEQS